MEAYGCHWVIHPGSYEESPRGVYLWRFIGDVFTLDKLTKNTTAWTVHYNIMKFNQMDDRARENNIVLSRTIRYTLI